MYLRSRRLHQRRKLDNRGVRRRYLRWNECLRRRRRILETLRASIIQRTACRNDKIRITGKYKENDVHTFCSLTIGYPCCREGLLAPPCRMGLLPKWCLGKYSFIFLVSKAVTDRAPLLPMGPMGPSRIPPPLSSTLRFLFLSDSVLGTFSGVFGSTSLSLCDEPAKQTYRYRNAVFPMDFAIYRALDL